ncbi:60S ribosomal protein L14 (macronuclear) [Tetrahymena thermophila SB210]|uniref:60S ribosomal protein L14 n=1 Tax=Tetrahymena thermophila (strain SB210) TaxID=312017 RepID=UPI0003F30669|nr:60S ribosomal protein L14 [Tetrahymena thermophila SB210]EAS05411.3 60S ribosomal protein L14 [Tetrahymena thermophila SB210]|eukprot:XP_001025656.3 60S ribosomal protein L14 [Tetrahymena thermophila SB210]
MSHYFVPMLMSYFVKIKKVFNKFVQVGRVVYINYGADKGKLAVIVNIINQNRILIDGEHIVRQVIPIRRVHLTKFQIDNVELNQRTVLLKKKIAKFDLTKKYAETSFAKKQAIKTKRANLGDFDRFRVMVLKKKLARTSAKSK